MLSAPGPSCSIRDTAASRIAARFNGPCWRLGVDLAASGIPTADFTL